MSVERIQGQTFGEVADEYDRFRPSYPDDLVRAVLAYTNVDQPDSSIHALEVGAGTGKATTLFAASGLIIEAVEPDAQMAGVLRAKTSSLPDVNVVITTFEDYQPPRPFDLLLSAQAWHWTDEATRWQKAAECLRPGGSLAIFGNYDLIADESLRRRFDQVHTENAPTVDWSDEPFERGQLWNRLWGPELQRQDLNDQRAELYHSVRTCTRADYIGFLATHSPYRMLPEQTYRAVFTAITEVLPDPVVCAVDSVLYLARRPARRSMRK